MESGYIKADTRNLPTVNSWMVANFFASNHNFIAPEFRNVKTATSSRQSYGDDAIGYVQLRRDSNHCIIKCKVCPEHRVRSKSYGATMIVDEDEGEIISVQCHDCAASQGGCKHSVAFLMWVHRRSEEPSSTETECYWKKSKLAQVGTTLKFITSKELSKAKSTPSSLPANTLLTKFLQEAKNRNIDGCQILKYQSDYVVQEFKKLSMHYLIMEYADKDCDEFINKISHLFIPSNIEKVEEETRTQHNSSLWRELRYGRITGSNAYSVMKCKTKDGSLVATIMGARTPETKAMKRGHILEEEVKKEVSRKLGKKIQQCGLFISQQNPYIAASPDGICEKSTLIEIKCPSTEKTVKNYIKDNKITEKHMAQVQMQMFVSNFKKCYFCVADWNFEKSRDVQIISIEYDQDYVNKIIQDLTSFWKTNIYPILYGSSK